MIGMGHIGQMERHDLHRLLDDLPSVVGRAVVGDDDFVASGIEVLVGQMADRLAQRLGAIICRHHHADLKRNVHPTPPAFAAKYPKFARGVTLFGSTVSPGAHSPTPSGRPANDEMRSIQSCTGVCRHDAISCLDRRSSPLDIAHGETLDGTTTLSAWASAKRACSHRRSPPAIWRGRDRSAIRVYECRERTVPLGAGVSRVAAAIGLLCAY